MRQGDIFTSICTLDSSAQGRIPKPIYDLLPYIYALVGTIIIATAINNMAVFSGCLFNMASVLVFLMRGLNRCEKERRGRLNSRYHKLHQNYLQ